MACPAFAKLHNGAKMPLLGYGTWQAKDDVLREALGSALRAGYRHIDTAAAYENEHVIGELIQKDWIQAGKLKRDELFVVTKLPPVGLRPGGPEKWLKRSLEKLRMDYVDVYLVHTPIPLQERGDEVLPLGPDGKMLLDKPADHVAIWKEMEAQVDAGRAKAIGVSNFNQRQIQDILDNCRIRPANLQVELQVYMQQRPLVEFCRKNGIAVTAYSPLGSPGSRERFERIGVVKFPDLFTIPTVLELAAKHKKQPAQILLKHIVQRGIVTIPKSASPERIAHNIQLFDFELSKEDVARLDALDLGKDGRIFNFTFWGVSTDNPNYPHGEYP